MNPREYKIYFCIFFFLIESRLVTSYEDNCGIYPSCQQYGDGSWQILEDCHKYIVCETVDGEIKQTNKVCEKEDQVFANEYKKCVDWNMASECKAFQGRPCLAQCPRVMLLSTGPGLIYQERRTGCFRIAGSLFGDTLTYYENLHNQFLTPDAGSTPFTISWLVSEKAGSFNGGIKNNKYNYIRCPFNGWTGWEVDKGLGHWVSDETMKTTCYSGDDVAPIPLPTTTGKYTTTEEQTTQDTVSPTTTTVDNEPCKEDGPNPIPDVDCTHDFFCCSIENGHITRKICTCINGLFYEEDVGCMWGDFMDPECSDKEYRHIFGQITRNDHTCSDGIDCYE